MPHDWANFPELRNSEMEIYYFESPHKQILEDFRAKVVKVHDGDTITVRWSERDFDFPIRFLGTNSPELNESGGFEAQSWLESRILDEEIDIMVDPTQRVEKWGRLLGTIIFGGININDEIIMQGHATPFSRRDEGKIPNLNEILLQTWV